MPAGPSDPPPTTDPQTSELGTILTDAQERLQSGQPTGAPHIVRAQCPACEGAARCGACHGAGGCLTCGGSGWCFVCVGTGADPGPAGRSRMFRMRANMHTQMAADLLCKAEAAEAACKAEAAEAAETAG